MITTTTTKSHENTSPPSSFTPLPPPPSPSRRWSMFPMADRSVLPYSCIMYMIIYIIFSYTVLIEGSVSPQNLETFYPTIIPPLPPSPPPPPPIIFDPPAPSPAGTATPASSSSGGSRMSTVATAVVATAASTLFISAVVFFILHRRALARRREKGDDHPKENPYSGYDTRVSRDVFVPAAQGRQLKGVIVDENGLDVLYWRKLESGGHRKSGVFNKVFSKRRSEKAPEVEEEEIGDGDDSGMSRRASKRFMSRVQETPLLSSDSLSSTHRHRLLLESSDEGSSSIKSAPLFPPPMLPAVNNFASITAPPPSSVAKTMAPSPSTSTNNFASIAAAPTPPTPPPPPPPPMPVKTGGPPPPPPPPVRTGGPPPPPPPRQTGSAARPPAVPLRTVSKGGVEAVPEPAKLKPLHWDKVNANANHSMVWDNIGRGSFQFDNELMEALFGYVATNRKPSTSSEAVAGAGNRPGATAAAQTFILDPRKSQNTAIVLRSLSVSRQEIMDALLNGHGLTTDTLEKLTRIAPTQEETASILDYAGNPAKLADAESFLFHVLTSVPTAFRRLDAMLFRAVYASELHQLKESVGTLEAACKELRSRGLFLKLLEAVLKAGNRLNAGTARGNAKAFKLAALRKLSDVKSTDGKTTLLHFVVEEVVRSEGKRCTLNRQTSSSSLSSSSIADEKDYILLGLPVVGGLSAEFNNVKKAASIDYDFFAAAGAALAARLAEVRTFVSRIPASPGGGEGFVRQMREFLDKSEMELKKVREEEKEVMEVVKKTFDYYQSGASTDRNFQALQLFVIVKEFLTMVDAVCVDIARNHQQRKKKVGGNNAGSGGSSSAAESAAGGGSPERKAAMRFPVLPKHFLSDHSKGSSDSEDDF